jgi:hypothetical protein
MATQLSSKQDGSSERPQRSGNILRIPKEHLWYYVIPLFFIVGFEVIKASHHSIFIGPGRKTLDIWATGFWLLDAMAATIVTFVMIRITIKFEEVHDDLEAMRHAALALARDLTETNDEVAGNTERMKAVSGTVASQSRIMEVAYTQLRPVFHDNPKLEDEFYASLAALSSGWAAILVAEAENKYADDVLPETHVALRCWGSAIRCYFAEESRDIERRTVASNLPVYLKLIDTIVEDVREIADKDNRKVELFASANLLPSEYYNWGPERRPSAYMDDYRDTIEKWRKAGIPIDRVIVVTDFNTNDEALKELRVEADLLGLQSFEKLVIDVRSEIICDRVTRRPKLLSKDDRHRFILGEPIVTTDVDDRYGIAPSNGFHPAINWQIELISRRSVGSVFDEDVRSTAGGSAKCLRLQKPEDATLLQLLPAVVASAKDVRRSVDFMAIRVSDGTATKTIACLAARAKPNDETMLLHFITTSKELAEIDEYIAKAASQAQSVVDLIK